MAQCHMPSLKQLFKFCVDIWDIVVSWHVDEWPESLEPSEPIDSFGAGWEIGPSMVAIGVWSLEAPEGGEGKGVSKKLLRDDMWRVRSCLWTISWVYESWLNSLSSATFWRTVENWESGRLWDGGEFGCGIGARMLETVVMFRWGFSTEETFWTVELSCAGCSLAGWLTWLLINGCQYTWWMIICYYS